MLYPLFLGSIVVLNSFLGLIVLIKNPKNHINISFALFVFSTVGWMIVNFLSNQVNNYNSAFLLNKLIFLVTPYMVYALLYFALVFPRGIMKFQINPVKLLILLIPVIVSNILTISNQTITQITFLPEGGTGVVFGTFGFFYAAQFLSYLFIAVGLLIYKFFKSTGRDKVQLQYLIFGIFIMMIFGSITNLFLPFAFNIYGGVDLAPALSLAVVGFTSYSILKHRLLDIRLIVARTVAYVLLLTLLGVLYVGIIYGISSVFVNAQNSSSFTFIYAILALFIAITSQPLRNYLNKITDKIFFKDNYNTSDLLARLSKILATSIDLEDITRKSLAEILKTIKISSGSFVIFHKNNTIQTIFEGLSEEEISKEEQKLLPPVINWFSQQKKIRWIEEEEDEQAREIMGDLNVSLIVPLMVEEKFHGVLLLKHKKSGDIYSLRDLNVLNIFGPEVSIAVENSKSYDEIRRFNITLKEEVDRQTKDLQNANQKMKELDKLKDEFVSLASHELRTPMTIIKSYLWLFMNKKKGQLTDKESSYLERAYTSTERLINLVNDMLNVSRIESGRLSMKMQSMQLMELLERLFTELTPRANQLGLKLNFTKPTVPIYPINADPERMEQVIINLIGNSFKFTPSGGEIEISVKPDVDTITVQIKDNGKGMNQEVKDKLFQKFGTMGGSYIHKQEGQGTGLGLYLSKSLIEMQGGKIWADSEGEGKGSTFSFSLPYKPQD